MRSAKKQVKKMPAKKITGIKPSKEMSYSHSNQPSKALTEPAGKSHEKRPEVIKRKKKESKKGVDKKILGEAVGEAGAALGQAISNMGTGGGAPPENYVSKVFARRSGFKMKYNKNNFPFKK